MDILRKELNAIYEAQRLLADWVRVSNACMVLTDASADSACLFTGKVSFPEYRNKVAILSK